MKEHDPSYGGTNYALALVAEHNGDKNAARQSLAKAASLWSHADPDMAELSVVATGGRN